MAEKLSDKLKTAFKNLDTKLGSIVSRKPQGAAYPKASEFKAFKSGQKTTNIIKNIASKSSFKKPTAIGKVSSATDLVTAKKAKQLRNIGKLKTAGRILSKTALPLTVGFEVANIGYQLATRTPEQKARTKALKAKLKKTSTKDYHSDLLKMNTGGDTMLKGNQKKLDKNKDGKISGEDFKMMKAKKGRMTYANVGMEAKSTKGYGAARTSGMGLQDEQLPPGKSLDYYKDLM